MAYIATFFILFAGYTLIDWGHYIIQHKRVPFWYLVSGYGPNLVPNPKQNQPVPTLPSVVTGGSCTIQSGDTKIPIPNTNTYMIWRPIGGGLFGQINGKLIGPCSS